MVSHTVKIGNDGRLVIPADIRHALGLEKGGTVVLRVEDNELRVSTVKRAIARLQALARQHVPPDVSLVDELLAERRREAERE
jgi:AbrB family looped-hinge helix DNA binding protein